MVKAFLISGFLLAVLALSQAGPTSNDCPLSSKMTTCSPKCKDDSECFGRKCCPNICNTKSCTPANLVAGSAGNAGYKGSSTGATGAYCGNVKCNSYEKCDMDKSTKRPKCVRQ